MTVRESFKYYNAIAVAGIYRFSDHGRRDDPSQPAFYFAALKHCIETHPMLARSIQNAGSDDERYVHVDSMDLNNHINFLTQVTGSSAEVTEDDRIARIMEHIHNESTLAIFNRPQGIPPWRLDILPLDASSRRIFISFTYSHCIADGMSGPNFHKTFLAALNDKEPVTDANFMTTESTIHILPDLPVSLLFLLGPALGHYLPAFLSRWLGLKASVSGANEGTWAGSYFFDDRLSPDVPVHTAVELLSLDSTALAAVLKACRSQNTKLTGLLNELFARCLCRRLGDYDKHFPLYTNLVSCVPINLRKVSGLPADALGNFAGGTYFIYPIIQTPELTLDEEIWEGARTESAEVAESAKDLQDQATGLLGWISDMKSWMGDHLGHVRDSSWELSNLMAFEGEIVEGPITVEKMFFSQPANLVGQPIQLNVMSVKGGDLAICVSWQVGACGLDKTDTASVEETERKLIAEMLEDLEKLLKMVAES